MPNVLKKTMGVSVTQLPTSKTGNLRLAFRSVPVVCIYSLPREVCWGKGVLCLVPQLGWTMLRLLMMIILSYELSGAEAGKS